MIVCPNCKDGIIKAYPGLRAKLRASILIFKADKCFAVCSKCKQETEVPVTLNQEIPEIKGFYVHK